MRTYIDESEDLHTFALVFDERDADLDDAARAVIMAAHAAGIASAKELVAVRDANRDAPREVQGIALQIFSQALGASLGLMFKEATPGMFGMMLTCARLVSLSPEERDEALAKMAEAVADAERKEPRH